MADNEEEVDVFDLSVQASKSEEEPNETETNVFSIEFDHAAERKPAGLKPGVPIKLPSPAFEDGAFDEDVFEAKPAPAESPRLKLDLDLDAEDFSPNVAPVLPSAMAFDADEFDEENIGVGQKITRMFGAIFGRPKDIDDFDDGNMPALSGDDDFSDLDSLPDPLDGDDLFDLGAAPSKPKPEGRKSEFEVEFEAVSAPDEETPEYRFETVTVPVVTEPVTGESGVFELNVSAAPEPEQEPVTGESGVFELNVPAAPEPEQEAVTGESGVFELNVPAAPEPEQEAAKPVRKPRRPRKAAEPKQLFNKIAHVCLHVKNLETSAEFYSNLGFVKRFAFNRDGVLFGIYLEFGKGNFVELFEDTTLDTGMTHGRLAHFCLETSDIDEVMKTLDDKGISYTPKKLGCDSTYQIWLKDPDGNEFEVHEYTPDSSQIIGRDVAADW